MSAGLFWDQMALGGQLAFWRSYRVHTDNSAKAHQPGEHSPFWGAVELWDKQGREFNSDGTCKWVKPPRRRLYHLGGKNYTESKELAAQFGVTELEP